MRATVSRSRDSIFVRGIQFRLRLFKKRARRDPQRRGRGEDRVHAAPAVSCARCTKRKRTRAYRFGGGSPAFPAQWLYGLYVLSPAIGFFATVTPEKLLISQALDASVEASGPHDFGRTPGAYSSTCPKASTASRRNVGNDGQRPLCWTGWPNMYIRSIRKSRIIYEKRKIFFAGSGNSLPLSPCGRGWIDVAKRRRDG
jgi:hypothetical protein